jgi:hypothetical protein
LEKKTKKILEKRGDKKDKKKKNKKIFDLSPTVLARTTLYGGEIEPSNSQISYFLDQLSRAGDFIPQSQDDHCNDGIIGKLCGLFTSLKGATDATGALPSKIDDLLQRMDRGLDIADRGIDVSVDHDINIPTLDQIFNWLTSNSDTIGFLVCIIAIIISVKMNVSQGVIAILVVVATYLCRKYYKDLFPNWEQIVSAFTGSEVKPQMMEGNQWIVGLLSLFVCGSYHYGNQNKMFKEFMKSKKDFDNMRWSSATLNESVGSILGWIQDKLNWLLKKVGCDLEFAFGTDEYPQVTELSKEIQEFIKVDALDKGIAVEVAIQQSRAFSLRIDSLILKHKADKDFSGCNRILNHLRQKLEIFDNHLDMRGAGRSVTRVPPKFFLFIGKPGIGKAFLTRVLTKKVLYSMYKDHPDVLDRLDRDQDRDYVFTRNTTAKHWEGYYNQPVVILDEVGMQRDVAGSSTEENEYSSVIKMVNSVPYPLTMANLELKGKIEFDSSFILGTTNNTQFQIESITNSSAYDRRVIKFEVEVNPKYGREVRDGNETYFRPDFDLMRDEGKTSEWIGLCKFLRFRERSSLFRGGYDGDWIDLDELFGRVDHEIEDRTREHNVRWMHNADLNSYFRKDLDKPSSRAQTPTPGSFYAQNGRETPTLEIDPQSSRCPGPITCACLACTREGPVDARTVDDNTFKWYADNLGFSDWETLKRVFWRSYYVGVCSNSGVDTPPGCVQKFLIDYHVRGHLSSKPPSGCAINIMSIHGTEVGLATCTPKSMYPMEFIEKAKQKLKKIIKGVSALAAFSGLLSVIYKFLPGFSVFGSIDCADLDNLQKINNFSPQVVDLNAHEVLNTIMRRSVYMIGDTDYPIKGFGFFIVDNIFVIPKHFMIIWELRAKTNPEMEVFLRRVGDGINHQIITIPLGSFMAMSRFNYGDRDLVCIRIGSGYVHRHRDIRQYLMNRANVKLQGEVYFPLFDQDKFSYVDNLSCPYKIISSLPYKCEGRSKVFENNFNMGYAAPTRYGDCGLPLVIKDPTTRADKMFGYHVAGNGGMGVAAPFSIEDYDVAVAFFSQSEGIVVSQFKTTADVMLDLNNNVGKLTLDDLKSPPLSKAIPGKVNLAYVDPVIVPTSTSILPSPLNGKIEGAEPKTKPVWLRPFGKGEDRKDPVKISTAKYHKTIGKIDLDMLDECVDLYNDLLFNSPLVRYNENVPRGTLPYEQAVAGIPGVIGLDGLPRSTSPGYPWVALVSGKGKTSFFGSEGPYEFGSDDEVKLRAAVENIMNNAYDGVRLTHVFSDFPKDERMLIFKVDEGKARKISGSALDFTVVIRMSFGAFNQFMIENRIYNQCAVGVNVFSSEWDNIADYLGQDSIFIAGDFSNYDGSLPYCLMVRFLESARLYYNDAGSREDMARTVLFEDLANSKHLLDGVIYEWVGSNSSGNPLTTVLNSWCNNILLRYATMLQLKEHYDHPAALKIMWKMDEFVRFCTYGDDNVIALRRGHPMSTYLSQEGYTKAFASMGLKYTDEFKGSGVVKEGRTLSEINFLKRSWKKTSIMPSRNYLSALSIDTILESIQWTKKKDYDLQAVKDNVVIMLQELSQHEEQIFDEYAPKIVAACRENMNFVPMPHRYRQCQMMVLARDTSFRY